MKKSTLELTKQAGVVPLPTEVYRSLNFDARGELLLSWLDKSGSIFVDCVGSHLEPSEFKHLGFQFPTVQRFTDGRWLIADKRCREAENNARVFSQDMELLREFRLDDAIEQVLVDTKGGIWVGYFDENPLGLREFSDTGDLLYDFNNSSGHDIFDLYAMHLDLEGDIWVYPYTDFYLARISSGAVEVVVERCPVKGAKAILVGGSHIAFFGSYDGDGVYLFDFRSRKGLLVELTVDGKPVERPVIATRGETAALLWQDSIYLVTLANLINATKV
ncbi:hypothetical protein [uncultured Litoreibacter sp.]|uniref:hypothetical protein n=1 Tax=uncultured Litoreibacter sp. TaxID=1392394 RepID=UPI0026214563|nr:hypothetical protein [uncultured Litoreibacter sp.]